MNKRFKAEDMDNFFEENKYLFDLPFIVDESIPKERNNIRMPFHVKPVNGDTSFFICTSTSKKESDELFNSFFVFSEEHQKKEELIEAFKNRIRHELKKNRSKWKNKLQPDSSDDFEFELMVKVGYDQGDLIIPEEEDFILPHAYENRMDIKRVLLQGYHKEIGEGAFKNCRALEGVFVELPFRRKDIRETLETLKNQKNLSYAVGKEAFSGCMNLSTLMLPPRTSVIKEKAFSDCISLEKLGLTGVDIKKIEKDAFLNCWNLSRINLDEFPDGLNETSLKGCKNLKILEINESLFYYQKALRSLEGFSMENHFYVSNHSLFKYDGDDEKVIVPLGVIDIKGSAFSESENIKEITLPDTVKYIQMNAFYGLKNLEKIDLPESIVEIKDWAFLKCQSLKEISLPEGLKYLPNGLFSGCVNLTKVHLPESLESIGDSAFSDCASLSFISLPEGLKVIHESAFYGCKKLKKIKLPASLTLFYDCEKVSDEVDLYQDEFRYSKNFLYEYEGKSEIVTVPDFITSMSKIAFMWNKYVKEIILPDEMKEISEDAFREMDALKSVRFSDELYAIHPYAFSYCDGLHFMTVPESVKIIGKGVFMGCKNLESVRFNNTLTKLPKRTFYYCESLEKVVISDDIQEFSEDVFMHCKNLKECILYEKDLRRKKSRQEKLIKTFILYVLLLESYERKTRSVHENSGIEKELNPSFRFQYEDEDMNLTEEEQEYLYQVAGKNSAFLFPLLILSGESMIKKVMESFKRENGEYIVSLDKMRYLKAGLMMNNSDIAKAYLLKLE